jgi:hypothetical protein
MYFIAAISSVSVYLFHTNVMEVVLVHWGMRTVGSFDFGINGLLWVNFHIFLKSLRPL